MSNYPLITEGDQGRESKRADAPKCEVRFAPINGHRQLGGARPISADSVAKLVLWKVSKIPRTAGALLV